METQPVADYAPEQLAALFAAGGWHLLAEAVRLPRRAGPGPGRPRPGPGARVIGVAEASQTFTGTIARWEGWTGLALPANGPYVVPDALAPLVVVLGPTADRGVCVGPGIWVQHRPQP